MVAFDRYDRSVDRSIGSIDSIDSKHFFKKLYGLKKKTPLLGELSQSSWDSFESDSESQDNRLNSPQKGHFDLSRFSEGRFDRFDIPFDSIDVASEGRGGMPWSSYWSDQNRCTLPQ